MDRNQTKPGRPRTGRSQLLTTKPNGLPAMRRHEVRGRAGKARCASVAVLALALPPPTMRTASCGHYQYSHLSRSKPGSERSLTSRPLRSFKDRANGPLWKLPSLRQSYTSRQTPEPPTAITGEHQLFDPHYVAKRKKDLEAYAKDHQAQLYPPNKGYTISLSAFKDTYRSLANGEKKTEVKVRVVGRIGSKRESSKKLFFYDLEGDETSVQVMASQRTYGDQNHFGAINELLKRGDIVSVEGFPCKTNVGELSVAPSSIELLAPCMHHMPEKEQLKDPELRYRQRYVDLLTNPAVRSAFQTRSKVISYIRNFLTKRKYLEVETPTLWPTVGGANARPFVAHSNALSADLFLRIAPELFLKQLVIGGFDRVFEIGKQFRNEGIDGTHNPEFTTCEFYEAHADIFRLIDMTEEMIRGLVEDVTGKQQISVEIKQQKVTLDFSQPFRQVSVLPELEAQLGRKLPDVNSFASVPKILEICREAGLHPKEPHTPAKLLDFLVGELIEPKCIQPTFLIDHPLALSPLAKEHRSKAGVTERFELLIGGKEICNAYSELNDPSEQRRRFDAQLQEKIQGDAEAQIPDEDFCR